METTPSTTPSQVSTLDTRVDALETGGNSGGWVEVDISNIPTDFSDNEELIIWVKSFYDISLEPSGWSVDINTSSMEVKSIEETAVYTLLSGVSSKPSVTFGIFNRGGDCISILSISTTSYTNWNGGGTVSPLFTINNTIFNGASSTLLTSSVNRNNVSTHVSKIFRRNII